MSGCTDKRFEKMLHAYDLGLLSEEDRAAFEMHQLECEYCFETSKKFNGAAQLMQHDSTVRETIHQLAADDSSGDIVKKIDNENRRWPIWLRSTIAVAAVMILLILNPWKVEISPRHDLIAAENLLAVMPFQNMVDSTDTQRLGEVIANLIMTDLSESQGLQVISNQRLYDLTKRLGIDKESIFDNDMVLQIVKEANAQWVVLGDILQTEPVLIVTSRIIDIKSGNLIKTQKIVGDENTTIFSLADSLSILTKHGLPIASQLIHDTDRMVADVTTSSPEAYRCYLEGVDYNNRAYFAEAVERFEKALEYDSTFAMVYYHLSNLKDSRLIQKAVEYSDKTTQLERYYITARQAVRSGDISGAEIILQELLDHYPLEKRAYFLVGTYKYRQQKFKEANDYLSRTIELDPLFKDGYNMLSYSYAKINDLDKALAMNDKFIFLMPNEPNPYDSRGDIYTIFKMYDDAIKQYKKALEKKEDFYASWRNLGTVYTYIGDFVEAERCFQVIAQVEDIYIWTNGKVLLGHNLMYQGKFAEALTMLEIGSQEDKKAHGEKRYATYHNLPALMYEELGNFDKALIELKKADSISRRNAYYQTYWKRNVARIVAESGDIARAQNIADSLKAGLETERKSLGEYWYAIGAIEMAQNNFAGAEGSFIKAIEEINGFDYSSNYMLGLSLLNMGKLDESIKQFDYLLVMQDSLPATWNSWDPRVYYYLGIAYEKSGNMNGAADNFKIYLNIRKDADVELETVIDAQRRLSNLIS